MSLHYLSNDLFGQIIVFLATYQHITFVIGLTLIMIAMYVFILGKCEALRTEKWAFALLVAAAAVLGVSPLSSEAHGARIIYAPLMELANQWAYHQPDYQIDTSTTYQLHEAGDAYHHPTKEGRVDASTGQIQGQIADPQGQMTQVKHGEPGSDLVEITYTIGDTEHKATVHLSDEKFIKLWKFVEEKPLPLSVLDNGDFVVDPYSQPKSSKQ